MLESIVVAIRPKFEHTTSAIKSLQIRCDIESEDMKEALSNAAAVDVQLSNPFSLTLKIGDTFREQIMLPPPLNGDQGKTKFSRKSMRIEYSAPVAEPRLLAFRPDSIFPALANLGLVIHQTLHVLANASKI